MLILPCEVASRSVVPAVKALMAKELVENHGLNQDQVAEILGISQSAVSKYTTQVRGCAVRIDDIDDVDSMVREMVSLLMTRQYQRMDLLRSFCQVCMVIRRTGVMCELCQRTESQIEPERCGFCKAHATSARGETDVFV
jgi:predicted transcriptional regulator